MGLLAFESQAYSGSHSSMNTGETKIHSFQENYHYTYQHQLTSGSVNFGNTFFGIPKQNEPTVADLPVEPDDDFNSGKKSSEHPNLLNTTKSYLWFAAFSDIACLFKTSVSSDANTKPIYIFLHTLRI